MPRHDAVVRADNKRCDVEHNGPHDQRMKPLARAGDPSQKLEQLRLEGIAHLFNLSLLCSLSRPHDLDHVSQVLLHNDHPVALINGPVAAATKGRVLCPLLCLFLPVADQRLESLSEKPRWDGKHADGKHRGDGGDAATQPCVVAQGILPRQVQQCDPGGVDRCLELHLHFFIGIVALREIHGHREKQPADESDKSVMDQHLLLRPQDIIKELERAHEHVRLQQAHQAERPNESGREYVPWGQQIDVERRDGGEIHKTKE
mmetsp:Transcript_29578/g.50217  ORF Transcript_29578/g.50217 Transcript_29578/m.50217 type:complete len:260 (-) Transcript_29578:1326-2105(-)